MKPWEWDFEEFIAVPPRLVFENYLDLEHVTVLHSGGIASYEVLERSRDACLVEIGTRVWGVTFKHLEWVQVSPPKQMLYRTRALWGTLETRVVTLIEAVDGGTRIRTHYRVDPAWFWRPFKKLLIARMNRWKDQVWKEDSALLLRRQKVLQMGFKDGMPIKTSIPLAVFDEK